MLVLELVLVLGLGLGLGLGLLEALTAVLDGVLALLVGCRAGSGPGVVAGGLLEGAGGCGGLCLLPAASGNCVARGDPLV